MKELNNSNFSETISSKTPVLVDFWAPWCGPCRMVAPVLEEVAADVAGKAEVCKLNIDDNPEIAAKYSVTSIPTLILFINGEEIERMVGVRPKEDIVTMINRF